MSTAYNIKLFFAVCLATILPFYAALQAQSLVVVNKAAKYCREVRSDSLKSMVELKNIVPGIVYDLRYATTQNFTQKQLYRNGKTTYLRLPAALALSRVQKQLAAQGLGLKIFDAYRPYAVTKKMWDLIHDDRYVANPSKGSGHNRGLSVDLTIINLATGKELDMGTGFDNFTDTAHQDFMQLRKEVLEHRSLLKNLMEQEGFRPLSTEWWHYSWPNDRNYSVLDLDVKKFRKACD